MHCDSRAEYRATLGRPCCRCLCAQWLTNRCLPPRLSTRRVTMQQPQVADGEGGGGGGGGPSTPATRRLPRRGGTARSGRKAVIGGRDPLRPRRKVSKPRSFYQRCGDMMMGWPFFPKMGNSKILFRAPDGGRLPGQDGQWEISRVEALDKLCAFVNDELEIPMEREADDEVRLYQLVPGQCSADPSCATACRGSCRGSSGSWASTTRARPSACETASRRALPAPRPRLCSPAPPPAAPGLRDRDRHGLALPTLRWEGPPALRRAQQPVQPRQRLCAPLPSRPFRPAAERCLTHPRAWPTAQREGAAAGGGRRLCPCA